jgi:MFS superfamily sulfate permease-like transporter
VKAPHRLGRWVPGLALLRGHGGDPRRDAVAGVVLAALLVPQGMAYAQLAGVPPVTGLYATLVPLVVYFLLGPSRILVLGPDSAVSPLVAAAIVPLAAAGDGSARIALAALLAILVGAIMFAGGVARFGFVTELLSMPVRLGYLMGIAVTVIVAQLPSSSGSRWTPKASCAHCATSSEDATRPMRRRSRSGGVAGHDPRASTGRPEVPGRVRRGRRRDRGGRAARPCR